MTRTVHRKSQLVGAFQRATVNLVYSDVLQRVYIEVTANHDGTAVINTVELTREEFASAVRELGVM